MEFDKRMWINLYLCDMLDKNKLESLIQRGEGQHVEFKVRVPSKVRELTEEICAFANADGGYLFIGIDDNGQIVGADLDNDRRSVIQGAIYEISPSLQCDIYNVDLSDKDVWVIEVPSGKYKPYIVSGTIYVRQGANSQKLRSAEEMRRFFQECDRIYFDSIPCQGFDMDHNLDDQTVRIFRSEAKLSLSTPDRQVFENMSLFADSGDLKNGAVLFFCKNPEELYPHAVIRCTLFKGTTKVYIIDDKTFGGPLYMQYLKAMSWLESKLQISYLIEGAGPRIEEWEIPLTVFKEAIINSLSHRDYYERGAVITVEMFDDRVEISNPGGLLPAVAKDFGHKSMTRNPLVFSLFTRMHLVERVASGIPRMCESMKNANLPAPEFHTEGIFTVIFRRKLGNSVNVDMVNGTVNGTVSGNERTIIHLLSASPGLKAIDISASLSKSLRTTMRYLKSLNEKGIVEYRGAPKTGGYYISNHREEQDPFKQ